MGGIPWEDPWRLPLLVSSLALLPSRTFFNAHVFLRVMASIQTVGQKDGFQRAYPDRASAEAAFELFENEQIYPDYGKAPWVVFLGRKTGVVTKMYVFLLFMAIIRNLTTLKHRARVVYQRVFWRAIPLLLQPL